MDKNKIKKLVLALALGSYRTIGFVGRLFSFVFLRGGQATSKIIKATFLPVLIIVYKGFFIIRKDVTAVVAPLRGAVIYIFVHRHMIHVAVAIIAVSTVFISLGNRTARAEDLGTGSYLYRIVTDNYQEFVEEDVSSSPESYPTSYLVGGAAVSEQDGIDFDYFDAPHVQTIGDGSAVIAPHPNRAGTSVASRTEVEIYVVQSGDAISTIAEKYGLRLITLLWANDLTSRSYIRPGDKLIIPPVDGVIHKVKRGETVAKIARTYNAKEDDVISWNKLDSGATLAVGETIVVPGGREPVVVSAPRAVAGSVGAYSSSKPVGAGSTASGGIMLWPVGATRITQYFGWRHTGLDVGAKVGTPIYAAEDGVVEVAGWNSGGYGNQVVVNHGNGIKTRYAHASKLYVKAGESVQKGETIAAVGSTGRSTGPHIHFEIIKNGKFTNPLEYVR